MEKRFLVLPVNDSLDAKPLRLCSQGRLLHDFAAAPDYDSPVFHAYVDITRFGDVPMTLTDPDGKELAFRVETRFPEPEEIPNWGYLRPQAHFTTRLGWINDPNGLIYANGRYHMFYQHNPAGWRWGNMTWGHAVSQDLLHWDEWGDALFPDEMGTMFSGSAVCDERNVSGLGAGAILLFYTAAGGTGIQSEKAPFTQCVAYSVDEGKTFRKYEKNPVISHIAAQNRDPKVQWSDELGKYTLSLFLDGHDYAIFTSDNLLDWKKFQDIHMPMDGECPDFFPLTASDGKTKWIFSGASDTYLVGELDAKGFHPCQEPLRYQCKPGMGYAAQTFSGMKDRRIKLYWEQVTAPGTLFNSQMSLPMELSLVKVEGLYQLCARPAEEWDRQAWKNLSVRSCRLGEKEILAQPQGVTEVSLELSRSCKKLTLSCWGQEITLDPAANICAHGECKAPLSYDGKKRLRLIFDALSLEVFADGGLIFSTSKFTADKTQPLWISGIGDVAIVLRELEKE